MKAVIKDCTWRIELHKNETLEAKKWLIDLVQLAHLDKLKALNTNLFEWVNQYLEINTYGKTIVNMFPKDIFVEVTSYETYRYQVYCYCMSERNCVAILSIEIEEEEAK